jgi:hypothetical protein
MLAFVVLSATTMVTIVVTGHYPSARGTSRT